MNSSRARTGKALALGTYGALSGVILLGFLARYPIPEFLPKIASILSAVWFVYALHACGDFLRRFVEPRIDGRAVIGEWGNRLTNAMVGFGLVSFVVLILGWAVPGDLLPKLRIVFGILFAVSAANWIVNRQMPTGFRWPKWEMPALIAALPAAGCIAGFLSSFTPITHYDALVYHLALPAIYLRQGAISTIPYNLYSFFPAATEMSFLFILGSLPAPEYTINVAGWILALVLGGAIAEWSKEIGGNEQAWISVLIWWTAPLVLLLSQGAYVDVPLAAATFLSVRWYLKGRSGDRRALVLAGLAGGIAFSVKYTGAMTILILGSDLAYLAIRRRMPWISVGMFVLAASILPAPWLIKNLIATGNPVFPFFHQLTGNALAWTSAAAEGYFRVLSEYTFRNNAIIDFFIGPWISSPSPTARGGFDLLGDFGWPIILLGAPIAYFLRKDHEDVRLVSAYALIHFIGWFCAKPVLRFLISLYPIGVVLASTAIQALAKRGRRTKLLTIVLVVPCIISNIFLYGLIAGELKMFTVPFGKLEPSEYLRQRLAFYPTFEALNAEIRADDRVLILGEQRTYRLNVSFMSSNNFTPSPVADICNGSENLYGLGKTLRNWSVTAIMVNESEISRLGGLVRFGFTVSGENVFRRFLTENTTVVTRDRGVTLYKINPN